MSFLFEDFWGWVTRQGDGTVKVTALNSWDDWITTTSAEDIGKCTAELVLNDKESRDGPIYIAGDTLTYRELADVVQQGTGKTVVRDVWPLEYLKSESQKEPDNKIRKYHVVFSEGRGLSWPKEGTWNGRRGMQMQDTTSWIKQNWT